MKPRTDIVIAGVAYLALALATHFYYAASLLKLACALPVAIFVHLLFLDLFQHEEWFDEHQNSLRSATGNHLFAFTPISTTWVAYSYFAQWSA